MKQLQHDTAVGVVREALIELRDYVPYEQRLKLIHSLYRCIRNGLEKYETMAQHRQRRLRPTKS